MQITENANGNSHNNNFDFFFVTSVNITLAWQTEQVDVETPPVFHSTAY